MSKDKDINYFLEIIKSWPDNGYPVALCGAEPTVRKDLPEFIQAIQSLPGKPRGIMILTNGVRLSELDYVKQFKDFKNVIWTIGLNHSDYQGEAVREKQMIGIENMKRLGLPIKNVSYTLENLNQLEDCLEEIHLFGTAICDQYRIRCGADIGRYTGDDKVYLSELINHIKSICEKRGWVFEYEPGSGNRSHYPALIDGIRVKIIQWPDVKTIDLREVQTETLSDIIPGKPPSPLVHQVILRDGSVNKGLPLFDTIPEDYVRNYGNKRN